MRASIFSLSLLGIAGTSIAQNADAVVNSVYTIGNTTSLLNSDVQNFNGSTVGIPWALQVQVDAVNLYRELKTGTQAAQSSSNFGEPGSSQVSTALLNIVDLVKTALKNTAGKASTFADLRPLVLASLYQLKMQTDLFANATIEKLAATEKSVAPTIKMDLDESFNDAIAAYGGKREFRTHRRQGE